MNDEVKTVIQKLKEVKDLLKKFDNKDEAIEFLVKETKLSKEECVNAYNLFMNLHFDKKE